ncbi:MAG: phosphotransferase [Candidatus Heimdallarchaeota archaeon]|nr:phosphotransferase [Candidatus Heimdallarchaeota archaeon]
MIPNEIQTKLESYYTLKFPEYDLIQVKNIQKLLGGWESILFKYTLIYSLNNSEFQIDQVIRLYPTSDGGERAKYEYDVLGNLNYSVVPIPEIYIYELDSKYLGYPFITMEYIHGQPFSKIFIEANEQDRSRLILKFTKILVDLHITDWSTLVKDPNNVIYKNPYYFLVNELNTYRALIEQHDKLEFYPILEWLWKNLDTIKDHRLCISHLDFHFGNIIVSDNEELTVIDWQGSRMTDFRFDLAWTLLIHETYFNKYIRDQIFNTYKSISPIEINNIKYFEVLSILKKLLDLSLTFSFGSELSRIFPSSVEEVKRNMQPIRESLALLYGHTRIKIPEIQKLL